MKRSKSILVSAKGLPYDHTPGADWDPSVPIAVNHSTQKPSRLFYCVFANLGHSTPIHFSTSGKTEKPDALHYLLYEAFLMSHHTLLCCGGNPLASIDTRRIIIVVVEQI